MICSLLLSFVGFLSASVPFAEPTDYGWRPRSWKLTPEAQALVREWNARPYAPKSGRTDFIVRAQLKYGINRNDFIRGWYDRPLLQDSSLGQRVDSPKERKPWLNAAGWKKTVEMGRLGKQAGFGAFLHTSGREEVVALSQQPGSEATILVELTSGMKHEEVLRRAEQALGMPNSYRLGGKVVLTSYPQIREQDLPRYAELKRELVARHGDKFVLMPYFSLLDGIAVGESYDAECLMKIRARLERALRVLDGFCQSSRDSYANRRYDPWLCENVLMPVVRGVFAEPEFKDKYLAWWATPGHENSYRWNYGLDCTGTRMLRDTLANIVSLHPDFLIGAEWDEENENTCFRPTVAHGFTHQRLLRYFNDLANRGGKTELFPGDDVTLPNLVLSYRKELMAGEPLEVEVLNIPDGSYDDADITVSFAWKRLDGSVARSFPPRRLKGGELAAAWFKEDVSKLVNDPTLVPELTIAAKGRRHVLSSGFWPVGLHTTRCIEYKWAKQPIRDLPKDITGSVRPVARDEKGVYTVRGEVKSARRLRSIAVLDEVDTVYMYDGEKTRDAETARVRISHQAYALNGKGTGLTGTIRLNEAPGAAFRLGRTRGDIVADGLTLRLSGAMYNNWPQTVYADVPLADAEKAVFVADVPGFFSGRVALKDLLEKGAVALSGPKGGNLVFSICRVQEAIPVPQMVNAADFTFKLDPGLAGSVLRLETVDEDYHVWRSAPFAFGKPTGKKRAYSVFERDAERVTSVTVDASRIEDMTYVFEPTRGSVVAGGSGRHLWGILGGCSTLVTGFGNGESNYGNTLEKAISKKTPDWERSAPTYEREADGTWSLRFAGASYVSLPMQLWPVQAGFALELVLCPEAVDRRQGLVTTGFNSSSIWIEKGRVYARFFLRNVFMKESGRKANVIVEGPAVAADRWQTVRLVCNQRVAWLEVDGRRGAAVPVTGDLFYPMYTALGGDDKGDFFAGRMKSFRVTPNL